MVLRQNAVSKKKQKGVSLIEVLVSSVVISMIFLWISDTHMNSLTDIGDSNNRTRVAWLSEEMLERIKVNPLIDAYRSEINGVSNVSSYCRSRENCLNARCTSESIVKYDVQQIYCNNQEIDGLNINFQCFDTSTGTALSTCATRGVLRGRVTTSWLSKNMSRERLSSYSDAFFSVEQSMFFDGGDYLQISGNVLRPTSVSDPALGPIIMSIGAMGGVYDFTIAAWVRPDNVGGYRGFFGKQHGSPSRGPSLWVSSGGGLHYDSYTLSNERHGGTIPSVFTAGQWTHVAWVKKGKKYFFYKNGAIIRTESNKPDFVHGKSDIWVGKVDNYFRGQLDEVQTYNVALSDSQIGSLMRGRSFPANGLTLYLDFSGNSFNESIRDKSPNRRGVSAYGGMSDYNNQHTVR